jgi:predicted peroxiredoxin
MIGYPMLMIGKTDVAKAYNPYGISLCLTENGDDYTFWFESTGKSVKDL